MLGVPAITVGRVAAYYWTVLKITSRSFRYALPHLWNQLPHSLRQPRLDLPPPHVSFVDHHCTSLLSPSPLLSPHHFFLLLLNIAVSQILFSVDIWHPPQTNSTAVRTRLTVFTFFWFYCFQTFLVTVYSSSFLSSWSDFGQFSVLCFTL